MNKLELLVESNVEGIKITNTYNLDEIKMRKLLLNDYGVQKIKGFGIYGMININSSMFLVVVTKIKNVGTIFDQNVYEIFGVETIQVTGEKNDFTSEINDIKNNLSSGGIYFSEYPIYKSISIKKEDTDFKFNELTLERLFKFVDDNIFSSKISGKIDNHENKSLADSIGNTTTEEANTTFNNGNNTNISNVNDTVITNDDGWSRSNNIFQYKSIIEPFTISCIQGYFGSWDSEVKVRLISRRSWRRCGTRLFCRGSDKEGYVANFVETEQLIYNDSKAASYLQVRGSIPLMWKHLLGREFIPPLIVNKENAIKKANDLLIEKYGAVTYLNLIKNSDSEKEIFEKYEKELKKLKAKSIHIDFAKEGVASKEEGTRKFISLLGDTINSTGCASQQKPQNGIIRTNCIDCLDRTNLSQYLIGCLISDMQLSHFNLKNRNGFDMALKKLWNKNGDMLSIQYSGSGAISGTLITGNKIPGLIYIFDLYISLKRYFLNRFSHGSLQTTYDILTKRTEGQNILPKTGGLPPLKKIFMAAFFFILILLWNSEKPITISRVLYTMLSLSLAQFVIVMTFFDFFVQMPRYYW